MQVADQRDPYAGWRIAILGVVAFLALVPVTLPVAVLRAFVPGRAPTASGAAASCS